MVLKSKRFQKPVSASALALSSLAIAVSAAAQNKDPQEMEEVVVRRGQYRDGNRQQKT